MKRTVLLLFLLLTGCGDYPRPRTEEEIREIAEDVADAVVSDRAPSASDTEDRLDELEQKLSSVEVENASLRSEIRSLRAEYEGHQHSGY
jgi:23S rRNA U2552 (ribose-2'-O)-methylase RlmE/FtsJ